MSMSNITQLVNDYFLKGLAGLAVYYLYSVAGDINQIKVTLIEVVKQQAMLEQRVSKNEDKLREHDIKFEHYDDARTEFYKTYRLEKK